MMRTSNHSKCRMSQILVALCGVYGTYALLGEAGRMVGWRSRLLDNIAKKLCRDFARTRERKRRFCGMGAAKMSVAVAVGHVSGCERWLTVPPLGRSRLADGHLWRCEKASFATPNTQNYQPNIAPAMQPADRQSVTKTR